MTTSPAPVGRPRVNPRPSDRSPEEEILFQAGRLFVKQGYVRTSTREIAAAAGFQQGSIFYYFPTKDDILVALVQRSMQPLTDSMALVLEASARPAAKLYRLVWDLAFNKLREPHDVVAVVLQHQMQGDRFAAAIKEIDAFVSGTHRLIDEGMQQGEFIAMHGSLAVPAVLGIVNWPSIFVRRGKRALAPEQAAEELARLALRGLLVEPDDLERVAAEAMDIRPPVAGDEGD